ncbi:MAG: FkbM family methyltransferase [Alphaproteobacteria bacterium]|nr:FkbM family methyltransferase [Alphaproteobacteria bacterium]
MEAPVAEAQLGGIAEVREVTVPLRTLDSYRLSPQAIKIDVQGFEESVIKGGLETIARCRPLILIERGPNSDAVKQLLLPFDYAFETWADGTFGPDDGRSLNFFA